MGNQKILERSRQRRVRFSKSTIINWIPPLIWAAFIFALSSIEQVKVSEFFFWDFLAKKGAHFTEYAILYFLIFRANGKNHLSSFILTMLYALTDEIHQSFVPGRTAAIYDIAIDFSGAAGALYIIWKLRQKTPAKHKK